VTILSPGSRVHPVDEPLILHGIGELSPCIRYDGADVPALLFSWQRVAGPAFEIDGECVAGVYHVCAFVLVMQ
jgi:hypothetical protein